MQDVEAHLITYVEADLAMALHSVTPDERRAAARIACPASRTQHLVGRALLRKLLGQRLGLPAASIPLVRDRFGKLHSPEIGLAFNIAHTGGMVGIVTSAAGCVGIDVEHFDRKVPVAATWHTVLATQERQAVGSDARRFIRWWVGKEAVMKADGRGFAMGAADIVLEETPSGLRLARLPERRGVGDWLLTAAHDDCFAWAVAAIGSDTGRCHFVFGSAVARLAL